MTTLITKNGSGAPDAVDLTAGELAVDLTNNRLYSKNSLNEVVQIGANPDSIQLKGVTETVHVLSGTTPSVDPDNGSIQLWVLSGNSTPAVSIADGQSLTLIVDDGTDYTITWPSTVLWVGGVEPSLSTTAANVIVLWAANSVIYGSSIGAASQA